MVETKTKNVGVEQIFAAVITYCYQVIVRFVNDIYISKYNIYNALWTVTVFENLCHAISVCELIFFRQQFFKVQELISCFPSYVAVHA